MLLVQRPNGNGCGRRQSMPHVRLLIGHSFSAMLHLRGRNNLSIYSVLFPRPVLVKCLRSRNKKIGRCRSCQTQTRLFLCPLLSTIYPMKVLALTPALLGLAASVQASTVDYTTVTGYFLQDKSSTDASTFDYVCQSLLIPLSGFL